MPRRMRSLIAASALLGAGLLFVPVGATRLAAGEAPPAPGAPAVEPPTDAGEAGRAGPDEVAPRPLLSPAEYARLADELRGVYSAPAETWPPPHIDEGVAYVEIGLVSALPPEQRTGPRVDLGKLLFFDPRLSGSGQISCASCHSPDLAWSDGQTVAFGHDRQAGKRNTPGLINVGMQSAFFWDGRAATLEEQAKGPIVSDIEMHAEPEKVLARIAALPGYREAFAAAFGGEEATLERVAEALAAFQRTIVSGRSRFDAFLKGKPEALSDAAVRGLHLFRTEARCVNCHMGPTFSDGRFHNLGLTYYGRKFEDLGRYEVTRQAEDVGAFKTPTLRNVTRTAPYMHNGLFELPGVINMYIAGMPEIRPTAAQQSDPLFPRKSRHLQPLPLNTQDEADLTAFLESLEEPKLRVRPPALPSDAP